MVAAAVHSIWRYPVSSMGGERLECADVGPAGIRGDRRWGVVEAAGGEIASPKRPRWYPTPHVEARLTGSDTARSNTARSDRGEDDAVELRLPGGAWLAAGDPATKAALAAHFGFAVDLLRHPAPGLAPGIDTVAPRYRVRDIHLVTTASLATLAEMLPDSRPDPRRFRPNLVVEWPDRSVPFPESAWAPGTEVTVGGARLRVLEPCRRCAFVTIAQPGLDRDPAVLAAVARGNGADFGVYCAVVRPGPVATGDPVRLGS